jgi:AraC-like DNA-binding protein
MTARELIRWRESFMASIVSTAYIEAMFDHVPDIVFCVKDRTGRYVLMSKACVERCGLNSKQDAIGKTAFALFPAPMAERYTRQDELLFKSGKPIVDSLDLTVYRDRSTGWCLSMKQPLCDKSGSIIGLACISKDLIEPSRARMIDSDFADAVEMMRERYAQSLRVEELSRRAKLSIAQFERRMKKIFQLSAGQYLMKARVDAAARLLQHSNRSMSDIALQAGFFDQSRLSRVFRRVTGMTPGQYRQIIREWH